jgi:hypothetical protein
LFLARAARNWEFAEYERHNIGGALERLRGGSDLQGSVNEDLIAAIATPRLAALAAAIKSRDPAAFRVAWMC